MAGPLRCVELFAGAGGMMLGLEAAGFCTVVANEVHAHPCLTIRRNFPGTPVVNGSIRDLTGRDLLDAAGFPQSAEVDLVAGGPPCQGFSTAGMKDPADPRNTLIGDFVRVVAELRPRYFLMENVMGLVALHDGELFRKVQEQLSTLKYGFHFRVMAVADYGVPQMRRRLIVLGARDGEPPPFPEPTHRSLRAAAKDNPLFGLSGFAAYTTCGEAMADLPAIGPGETALSYDRPAASKFQRAMREGGGRLYNHEASKHKSETMAYYSLVPPGGTWLDIPPEKRKLKQGMQRWPLDGLSRTITTEPTDFLHPTLDRIPTVRELARIQSFPDRYEFMGQRTTGNKMRRLGYCSQTQQVGNAVPPMFAEAIGRSIYRHATGREAPQHTEQSQGEVMEESA